MYSVVTGSWCKPEKDGKHRHETQIMSTTYPSIQSSWARMSSGHR